MTWSTSPWWHLGFLENILTGLLHESPIRQGQYLVKRTQIGSTNYVPRILFSYQRHFKNVSIIIIHKNLVLGQHFCFNIHKYMKEDIFHQSHLLWQNENTTITIYKGFRYHVSTILFLDFNIVISQEHRHSRSTFYAVQVVLPYWISSHIRIVVDHSFWQLLIIQLPSFMWTIIKQFMPVVLPYHRTYLSNSFLYFTT